MDPRRLDKALERIREGLRKEGGDIELVDVKDGVVYVRLEGECRSCMMAGLTMKNWVEKTLREEVPGVKGVRAL